MATSKRYSITHISDNECIVEFFEDIGFDIEAGTSRQFWSRGGGGYVYEVTDSNPGTSGHQVCDGLLRHGPTLTHSSGPLAATIRRHARRYVAQAERCAQ